MSLTFLQLQNKVLGWLDETADSSVVLGNVKEALAAANAKRASAKEWPFMLTDATVATVVGARDITLATDFATAVFFRNPLTQQPMKQIAQKNQPLTPIQSDMDGTFTLQGQTLRLNFLPTSVFTITYQYYRQPIELSADADLPDIPYPHSRILIYDALLALGLYSEDLSPNKVAQWTKEQMELEANLYAAYMDSNTLGAYVNQVASRHG